MLTRILLSRLSAPGQLAIVLTSCLLLNTPVSAAEKIRVFVSVLPQKFFVEQVGGDQVEVDVMVQPGDSPATYEPSPRQISKLARAELYIRSGVPFENAWMDRIRAVNADMVLVDARDGLPSRTLEAHHHDDDPHDEHHHHDDAHAANEGEASREQLDPHIWTSPRMVMTMSEQIRDQLSRLRPDLAPQFAQNQQAFAAQLAQLDQELTALFANTPHKQFMVFHPSWGYFADAYGLTQIPIETNGKEPGAKALTALINQARANQVKVIFVQPQFDRRAAEQVAKAIDGEVVAIDPLAENYLDNLRHTAALIAGVEP